MPRYRFNWSNLTEPLVSGLAASLHLTGDPAGALRRRYGARPKTVFIKDNWLTLLRVWLPLDDGSRESVVAKLWAAGLGEKSSSLASAEEQLDYLKTCRNASTLREVVLSAFLAAGESVPGALMESTRDGTVAQAATDAPAPAGEGEVASASGPSDKPDGPRDLNEWVEQTLKTAYGFTEIYRDEDGDIPLPRGSSVVFIRPRDEKSPYLEIFAPLIRGFDLGPDLYEAVNSINTQVPLAKAMVFAESKEIYLSAHLLADTLSSREFLFALNMVSDAADHFDTLLKKRFGGQTMAEDDDKDTFDV